MAINSADSGAVLNGAVIYPLALHFEAHPAGLRCKFAATHVQ